jgi:hypothetical protein
MEKPPKNPQEAYRDNHLALGLGAGVSLKSGVPNWYELVKRVAEQPEVGSTEAVAAGLLTAGYDATVVGGDLRSLADSNQRSFIEAVRRSLYEGFDAQFPKLVDKFNHRAFAQLVREKNPTLHAVGSLCGRSVGPDKFEPNLKIRAVLNFNLDFLLQTYTRARFKKRVLRTVERASASASGRLINAYHPHGYLLRGLERNARDPSKESDRLVLTEHQYYDVVAASNSFANYTILFLLRTCNFLFVGLSMTDPNLRRTLHLSRAERMRELKAEGKSDTYAEEHSRRHWAVMKRDNDATINQAIGAMLRELGVEPLWLENWSELPPLLEALYESTAKEEPPLRWTDVV